MNPSLRLLIVLACALSALLAVAASASAAAPANDAFSSSQEIYSLSPFQGTNDESTVESGEVAQLQTIAGWGFSNTVWHAFTAPVAGEVSFAVCSNFATNVVTTAGSTIATLTAPATNGGVTSTQGLGTVSELGHPSGCAVGEYYAVVGPMPIAQGATLRPMVGSAYTNQTGSYRITTNFTAAPENDSFADRVEVYSRHKVTGSNAAASTEANEMNNPYTNWRTVWYEFDAPATSTVDIDVCSNFAANLVAYNGTSLPLTPIANAQGAVPGGCGDGIYYTYLTNVPVSTAGKLMIQLGGYNGYSYQGDFELTVKYNGAPPNDLWQNAKDLGSGESAVDYGDSVNASTSPETPKIDNAYRSSSVWYSWTAPTSAPVLFDTCDGPQTNASLMLAVFSAEAVAADANNTAALAFDKDGCSGDRDSMGQLTMSVTAGTTYLIVVSSELMFSPGGSDFTLRIRTSPHNTAAPQLSGAGSVVGSELTASQGTWGGSAPISYSYQWLRCNASGEACTDIVGAQANTYTLAEADAGYSVRALVTATNAAGDLSVATPYTSLVGDDSDGDGVGDSADDCDFVQSGTVKANGCVPEEIDVTSASSIEGDPAVDGAGLSINYGEAENSPGDDPGVGAPTIQTVKWYSCDTATETSGCTLRDSDVDDYVTSEDDLGGYTRVAVTWQNDDSSFIEWTAAVVIRKISPSRPTISGVAQVGQTLTGDPVGAVNQPAGGTAPSVVATQWFVCPSASNSEDCATAGSGTTFVVPASAVGKYIRFGVTWQNDFAPRGQDSNPSEVVIAAPGPPAPTPLTLAAGSLPKKASAKGLVKAKGKFTVKSIAFVCPAGGTACKLTLNITAKIKKKTYKLGGGSFTIPAGGTLPLQGKLSASGLKLVKKYKKVKATLAASGSGGATGKASMKEFTVTK